MGAQIPRLPAIDSFTACSLADEWMEAATETGLAIRVLEATTGLGKTFVAQNVFDHVRSKRNDPYWNTQLTLDPKAPTTEDVLRDRKRVIPAEVNQEAADAMRFLWFGIAAGETDSSRLKESLIDQIARLHQHVLKADQFHRAQDARGVHRKAAATAYRDMRDAGASEFADVGIELATGLAGPVAPLIRAGMRVIGDWRNNAKETSALLESPDEYRRQQAFSEIRGWLSDIANVLSRHCDQPIPLVVLIDDAHAASEELLQLLEVLTGISDHHGDPTTDINPVDGDDADNTAKPDSWESPLPGFSVLLLATTWPEDRRRQSADLFEPWLRNAMTMLPLEEARVQVIPLREPNLDTLQEAFIDDEEAFGQSPGATEALISHFERENETYNPLVVVRGLATLRTRGCLRRSLMGDGYTLTPNEIWRLDRSPTYHLNQRIEQLLGDEEGFLAYELLKRLVIWGAHVPYFVAQQIFQRKEKTEEHLKGSMCRLSHAGIANFHKGPIDQITIAVDFQLYILDNHTDLPESEVRAVAPDTRNAIFDNVHHSLTKGIRIPNSELRNFVERAVQLEGTSFVEGFQLESKVDTWTWFYSASAKELLHNVNSDIVLEQLAFGHSNVALSAAMQLANACTEPADKIRILLPHANHAQVAIDLANTYTEPAHIKKVLEPHAKHSEHAAIKLANIYTDPSAQIAVLRPLAHMHNVAIRLAGILTDPTEKIAVLEPFLEKAYLGKGRFRPFANLFVSACEELPTLQAKKDALAPHLQHLGQAVVAFADLHDDPTKKKEILKEHVGNNYAAQALADLYDDPAKKIEILEPHANNEHVAQKLADLHDDPAKKIHFLKQHTANVYVALKLADLHEEPAEKIEILKPHFKSRYREDGKLVPIAKLFLSLCDQLPTRQAIEALETHADNPFAAKKLKQLRNRQ